MTAISTEFLILSPATGNIWYNGSMNLKYYLKYVSENAPFDSISVGKNR